MNTQVSARSHVLFATVIIGIVVIAVLEVVTQALPPHYSPISQSESALAVGPYGYLMSINFIIRGLITFVFLLAFTSVVPKEHQSRWGLILVGLSAIGKIVIAFVATDLTPRPETAHGAIHALIALTSFFLEALGLLLMARALRHDTNMRVSPRLLIVLATATFVMSLIVIATVFVSSQIGIWGLLERLFDCLFYSWIVVASIGLWNYEAQSGTQRRMTSLPSA